ncbi:MAG TPA: spore coat U domain-containing protein, partial [Pseudomonadaceae bacterium]|nr:spore coat U domain-containing protein [Pseudomonadaceae bacterium]
GETSSLATAINGQTTITLDCPSGTNWKLGLNNGMHALSGQRRMAGPANNHVEYELYRDPARSQRWGNDRAGGTDVVSGSGSVQSNPTTLEVYGRVPAQAPAAAGSYSDTITVTLEY